MPMHLASDYFHPFKDAGGRPSHFRVCIYLPDDIRDAPVVICSELPTPLVWVEHWSNEATEGQETFELVVFSSYEVVERAPYLGETRPWIRDATWKPLDRASVEVLVDRKV
jgi:hypothetical protein